MKRAPAVAVYRGDSVTAAEICILLGGSGVDVEMQTTFGFRASGGRVMVPASQAERARDVLKAYGRSDEVGPSHRHAVFTLKDGVLIGLIVAAGALLAAAVIYLSRQAARLGP